MPDRGPLTSLDLVADPDGKFLVNMKGGKIHKKTVQ
jgi:hypothetical protein